MKRILSLGLALALAGFGPAMQSAYGKHQSGKGKGHAGAVAHRAPKGGHGGAMAHRAPNATHPKSFGKGHAIAGGGHRVAPHRQRSAPNIAVNRSHQGPTIRGNVNHGSKTARIRNEHQKGRQSIAFGGTNRTQTNVNNRVSVENRNSRFYYAPEYVHRGWDRGRVHEWNHHRYHWRDGAWVILDPGFSYGYDVAPTYTYELSLGDATVSEVQRALQRKGYDPGPADGVIGSRTRDAIAAYKDDHGLAVNGLIDRALLRSLDL